MKTWRKVKLGTLLTESKVVSENPNADKRIRVKLNVLGVEKRPITRDKKNATKYYKRKAGQFIYGTQNLHKGAFGIVPEELDGFESSSDIPTFDIDESCYPEWIFYFFKKGSFYLKLESLAKGVGSKRIHPEQIFDLDIFLPSKEEQRKVLDEIEKAEKNNQKLISEIHSQEESLAQLRQSILQDAMQGKLTKEWRIQNPDEEPASELLRKIKAEKEQLEKEKKIRKGNFLSAITKDEIPYEIPKSWSWCRIQDVASLITDGTHKTPNYVSEGIPFISAQNLFFNRIDYENVKYITDSEYTQYFKNKTLLFGDVLLAKSGTLGISAVFDSEKKYAFYESIALIRPFTQYTYSRFLSYYLNFSSYRLIEEKQKGVGVKHLHLIDIRSFELSLPPFQEQKIIAHKVSQLLDACDTMQQEIKFSITNTERLIQTILIELLGDEKNVFINKKTSNKIEKNSSREVKYNSKTTLMELVELLKENGKLHAEDLWKMSKYLNDIDAFYSELKKQIEEVKSIKEVVNEKGYLELA